MRVELLKENYTAISLTGYFMKNSSKQKKPSLFDPLYPYLCVKAVFYA